MTNLKSLTESLKIMEDHAAMVQRQTKNGGDIMDEMTSIKAHLWHMATGVATEAGELLDCIKKHVIYDKDLDETNLIEELGDLEYYMEGLRASMLITRQQCLEANIIKLSKRYEGNNYSNQQAIARTDKAE